jgi:hypothetical protein
MHILSGLKHNEKDITVQKAREICAANVTVSAMSQNIEKSVYKHGFINDLTTIYSHSKVLPATVGQQNFRHKSIFSTRTDDLELNRCKTNAVKENKTSVQEVRQQLAKNIVSQDKSHYAILATGDKDRCPDDSSCPECWLCTASQASAR